MKRQWVLFFFLLICCGATTSLGQFSQYYAPSNWFLSTQNASSGYSFDASLAPASISMTCNYVPGYPDSISYSITAIASGPFSIYYSFGSSGNSGTFQILVDNIAEWSNAGSSNGDISLYVSKGTTFGFRVVTFGSSSGSSTVVITNFIPPDSVLPGELVSFTANASLSNVELQWKTATEVNNSEFEIERQPSSTQLWTKIGSVAGSGTSNSSHNYSYIDNAGTAGTYSYRLKQIDHDGAFVYSQTVQVTIEAPKVFALSQNYPEPFNPSTTIQFTVPNDGRATLNVYNAIGQEVATLFNDETTAGVVHQVQFNGSNLASGVYFSRLEFGGKMQVKKMLLLK